MTTGNIAGDAELGNDPFVFDPDEWARNEQIGFCPESMARMIKNLCFQQDDSYNVQAIRQDFPILLDRINGRRLVWLDNAATTQKPRCVIDRIVRYYEHENSNVHRAAHTLAARATDAYEEARGSIARFLNALSSDQIIFVRGTTEAVNLVACAYGKKVLKQGDEVLLSQMEHHANIVPWQMICAEAGAEIRVIPVDEAGRIDLGEYGRMLGPKTKIVALTHVSNVLGTVNPVAEMTEMAHRYGARVLVDGAQAVAHRKVDVQTLDCDFYTFSGHKLYGPTGIGALYVRQCILDEMPPYQGGGSMISDVSFDRSSFRLPPHRFEAGTGNIAGAAGLGAAIEYVTGIGLDAIEDHESQLLRYTTKALLGLPGLRIIGTADEKASVISFAVEGLDPHTIGKALDAEGIAVRAGHHCAQPILRKFGLEGAVRASLAMYNTRDEIDALASVLRRLVSGHW